MIIVLGDSLASLQIYGQFVFNEVIFDTDVLLSEKGYIFTITTETVTQNVTVHHNAAGT
jgi:uncharacterized membrane protein YiaA